MSEKKIMYRVRRYENRIDAVEMVKLTACFVTFKDDSIVGQRPFMNKVKRVDVFDTWGEAHKHLLDRATNKVIAARRYLELANSALGNIKGMKPPAEDFIAASTKKEKEE